MTSFSSTQKHPARLAHQCIERIPWLLGGLLAISGVYWAVGSAIGLHVNVSPSLPAHAFVETGTPAKKGDVVMFCPPVLSKAVQQLYDRRMLYGSQYSSCPAHMLPLAKVLVAVGGDTVTVADDGISVNGEVLPNTRALAVDREGRPLVSFRPGVYQVQAGQGWVLSTYHPRSFDSRYFGPVDIHTLTTLRILF